MKPKSSLFENTAA